MRKAILSNLGTCNVKKNKSKTQQNQVFIPKKTEKKEAILFVIK